MLKMLTLHAFYTLFSLSMHTSIRHSAQTLLARSLWLRHKSQGKTSSTHVSSSWHILLFVVAVSSLWLVTIVVTGTGKLDHEEEL